MQFQKPTDTPSDSPLKGLFGSLPHRIGGALDATRRRLLDRLQSVTAAVRRRIRANSLVRVHQDRISVGIEVGDLGLSRLEPADIGA